MKKLTITISTLALTALMVVGCSTPAGSPEPGKNPDGNNNGEQPGIVQPVEPDTPTNPVETEASTGDIITAEQAANLPDTKVGYKLPDGTYAVATYGEPLPGVIVSDLNAKSADVAKALIDRSMTPEYIYDKFVSDMQTASANLGDVFIIYVVAGTQNIPGQREGTETAYTAYDTDVVGGVTNGRAITDKAEVIRLAEQKASARGGFVVIID